MATLEKIKLDAARTANREGKPMAVLNLNQYNPLYVIRTYDAARMDGHKDLVWVVHPSTIDGDGF